MAGNLIRWNGTTEYETGPGDASTSSGALTDILFWEGDRLMTYCTSSPPPYSISPLAVAKLDTHLPEREVC